MKRMEDTTAARHNPKFELPGKKEVPCCFVVVRVCLRGENEDSSKSFFDREEWKK